MCYNTYVNRSYFYRSTADFLKYHFKGGVFKCVGVISTIICLLPFNNLLFENKVETQFPNTNILCLVEQKQGSSISVLVLLLSNVCLGSDESMDAGGEGSMFK